MIISKGLVERMGFEEFAFNLVVNEIENGNIRDGFKHIQDDGSLVINQVGEQFVINIRCYVPTLGWKTAEFNLPISK